jgi:hypothetical protein
MNVEGRTVCEKGVQHSGEAINVFLCFFDTLDANAARACSGRDRSPTRSGAESFLERNYAVFAVNPKQLDGFRDRHTVAGAKDDRPDG